MAASAKQAALLEDANAEKRRENVDLAVGVLTATILTIVRVQVKVLNSKYRINWRAYRMTSMLRRAMMTWEVSDDELDEIMEFVFGGESDCEDCY